MNWKMKHNDAWLSFISVHCLNYCINQIMFSHSYFFCQLLVCLKQTLCYWWGNSLTYQIFINHSTLLEMNQTQSGASYWGLVPKPRQAYGWYSNQKPSDSKQTHYFNMSHSPDCTFFLSAIWLPQGQLSATNEEAALLTQH